MARSRFFRLAERFLTGFLLLALAALGLDNSAVTFVNYITWCLLGDLYGGDQMECLASFRNHVIHSFGPHFRKFATLLQLPTVDRRKN